jgi:hypothetical protein
MLFTKNYDYEIIECDGDYKNILKKIGKIKKK